MKEKFYVFTDIDGTLYDINYIHTKGIARLKEKYGENFSSQIKIPLDYEFIDPKCVKALNYLLEKLEEKYDAKINAALVREAAEVYENRGMLKKF